MPTDCVLCRDTVCMHVCMCKHFPCPRSCPLLKNTAPMPQTANDIHPFHLPQTTSLRTTLTLPPSPLLRNIPGMLGTFGMPLFASGTTASGP